MVVLLLLLEASVEPDALREDSESMMGIYRCAAAVQMGWAARAEDAGRIDERFGKATIR